jgi:RNA polymerase sigma-70 factor, ECF subfamily
MTTTRDHARHAASQDVVPEGTRGDRWMRRYATARAHAISAPSTDAALIIAFRNGDDRAFEQLFDRYARRLAGMCWRCVHDRALVDDIVQETFARLARNAGVMPRTGNVSAWIHRVALNLCLDEVRRRSVRKLDVALDAVDGLPTVERIADSAHWTQPELAFDRARTRAMVRQAIARLPERQRRVLVLRELDGMGYQQIAEHLGVGTGVVHGLLHRAREGFTLHYMELDGLEAPLTTCAQVTFLRENFGRAGLRADRRRSVTRHLVGCHECAEAA